MQNAPLSAEIMALAESIVSSTTYQNLENEQQTNSFSPRDSASFQLAHMTVNRQHALQSLVQEHTEAADYQALEALLVAEDSDYGRKGLIALKLHTEEFTAAQTLINALPEQTQEEEAFKFIQQLNLARLSTDFILDSLQEAALYQIAEGNTQNRAYAQSLLIYLTGAQFIPEISEAEQRRSRIQKKPTSTSAHSMPIQLAPNPNAGIVNVQLGHEVPKGNWTLNVYDITGRIRKTIPMKEQRTLQLLTNDLENGTFIIFIQNNQKVSYQTKMMVIR